jgi:GT2 family glycosyltransferase
MQRMDYTPAAVRELAVADLGRPITGISGYERAFIVFRHGSAVVGSAWVPVSDGRVAAVDLRALENTLAGAIWQRMTATVPVNERELPTATVVVCTRDRPEDMARCLPGLAQLADQGHDVVVIDNCPSNDRTRELVALYPQVRYILEARAGLDVARNRGLREAQGAIVAFTDDDAMVDPAWLDALRANFTDPTVALVTGITMPIELETPAQIWFEQTNGFQRGYERRVFDLQTVAPLGAGRIGAGVNMAIRRSALRMIGLFDEALDGGTPAMSGGDQEFFYRVLARGFRAVYDPAALVWHRHRRDWAGLQRCIEGYGVGLFAWWTRAFLVEGDWNVLKDGTAWFVEHHVREAARALLARPGASPRDLAFAELRGALAGPGAYLRARTKLREQTRKG